MTEEKGELENAKGREHESIFTFEMAFLECFQTDLLPQAEQSVVLLARERCRTVNISSRHRSRVNLQIHFRFTFGILFPST